MAETTREMVVRLTMDAGGFKKTANEINTQIRNIDREIRSMGDDKTGKRSKLEEKLGLQKTAVDNLKSAVDQAKTKLAEATTEKDRLLAAKQLSGLETSLETAENRAKNLANELRSMNLMNFSSLATSFGNTMKTMGRKMSLYVGAPLAALGGKAYKSALDYESATVSMQKTIDETDTTKYEDIKDAFKEISEVAPVAYTELMELAGQAGALGLGADQVVKFVETVAMLSVTADDLSASTGAEVLARFLNITEQGDYSTISKVASAVTHLGNNLATTEGELMYMAQRMASTGELAGVSVPDILALAAAFTSVGINAEAGGSASGKLMKRMQLAAEVGSKAVGEFADTSMTAGMSIREIQLAADDGKWMTALADEMGKTKKETKSMIDAMVSLQDFSDLAGISIEGFGKSWDKDAGGTMLQFFQGLNDLETSGGEQSILTKLNEMGLTEIRLSNLIAAAASNPDLFRESIRLSNEAYEMDVALAEEAEKRYATAESFGNIQLNKMENAAADVGENIVDVVQPVIEKVADLAKAFGELDEASQDRWIAVGGALIALGPVASAIGNVSTAVGKIAGWAGKLTAKGVLNFENLFSALTGPAGGWLLVAGGLIGVVAAVNSLDDTTEGFKESLRNIEFKVDEATYNETMAAIDRMREKADLLSGDEGTKNAGVSAAVQAGYGTAAMFGQAFTYETALAEKAVGEASGKYSKLIDQLNEQIVAAVDGGETNLADELERKRTAIQAEWDAAVSKERAAYSEIVGKLFAGMVNSPEMATSLEQAGKDYDLFAAVTNAIEQAEIGEDVDFGSILTADIMERFFGNADMRPSYANAIELKNAIAASLTEAAKGAGGESVLLGFWNAIMDNEDASSLLDLTKTQGVFDGWVELMDFAKLGDSAGAAFGTTLTPGLADPITEAIPAAQQNLKTLGDTLRREAAAQAAMISNAFNAGLQFHIPGAQISGAAVKTNAGSTTTNNVTINASSPTAGTGIYGIQRGLTDALQRVNRGYGKA